MKNGWEKRQKTWTDEKLNWLRESKKKYEDREDILVAFNEHFKTNINLDTLRNVNAKFKLELPKAKKAMEKGWKNLETGWLKIRGFTNKKIGDEIKVACENRTYIKISNSGSRYEKYVEKQRYLYEKYHDVKLHPIDDVIVFLNGDRKDFRKENLYKVSRSVHTSILGNRLYTKSTQKMLSRIKCFEWKEKINQLDKKTEK